MKGSPIIEIRDVYKRFKHVQAVAGVSLDIQEGEFVGLLGPNGAGKTTLVEMIEGLQTPDSGRITINGYTWKEKGRELHSLIGLSLQETRLIDKLSVYETLILFASFHQVGKTRIEEILELINLQDKRKAMTNNLSGGQRQRLALGLAALHKPKILLLDEPTTGLDPSARRDIWEILLKMKKEDKTSMILTTHYMEEAEYLCDRIVIMNQGTFIAQGTLQGLLSGFGEGNIIDFIFKKEISPRVLEEQQWVNKIWWQEAGKSGKLSVPSLAEDLPKFMQWATSESMEFTHLDCRRVTLEDLFLSMTGRRLNE